MTKKSTIKKQDKEVANNYGPLVKPWNFGMSLSHSRTTNNCEAATPSYVISSEERKKED